MEKLTAFKAYDIRGRVPEELDGRLAYVIGTQVVPMTAATRVVVGHDARLESPMILDALAAGLQAAGAEVLTLGLCGTEEVYAATAMRGEALGIMVTASHNPKGYNGMKMIKADGVAFGSDDLTALEALCRKALPDAPAATPAATPLTPLPDARAAYLEKVLSFIDAGSIKPMKVVVNCMNGSAGPALHEVARRLPQIEWVWMQDEPDGDFPHGLPNPLLPAQREKTAAAVREHRADLGVAFDGDFDRCFLFTHEGRFVAPYYTAGMLADILLSREAGATVLHDPRLYLDTLATIEAHGGRAVKCRAGHLFFKHGLREEGAVFGAETSGHYFFRDFFCCDSGVIPFLLSLQAVSDSGRTLADMVQARMEASPCADETNFRLCVPAAEVLDKVRQAHAGGDVEDVDGLGLLFDRWRCNLRASNTEPLLRLNIEARDASTLEARQRELVSFIEACGATRADH